MEKSSHFYNETKALVRELDREKVDAKILKKRMGWKINEIGMARN